MTWNEMEGFAQYCINKGFEKEKLKDLAKRMGYMDSVNFVLILEKRGIEISI